MILMIKYRSTLEACAKLCGHEVWAFEVGMGVNIDGDFRDPRIFNPLTSAEDLYQLESMAKIDVQFLGNTVIAKSSDFPDLHEVIIHQEGSSLEQKMFDRALASCRVGHLLMNAKKESRPSV